MRWNGRGELVCPLRGQSLESRLAAQRSVMPTGVGLTERLLRLLIVAGMFAAGCRTVASSGGVSGGTVGAVIGDDVCAIMVRVEAETTDADGLPVPGAEVWELPAPQPDPPRGRAYRLGITDEAGSLKALSCYMSTTAFHFWSPEREPVVIRLIVLKDGFGVQRVEVKPASKEFLLAGSLMDGPPGNGVQMAKSLPNWQGRWYSVPLKLLLRAEVK